jgi:hypothetical protein
MTIPVIESIVTTRPTTHTNALNQMPHIVAMCRLVSHSRIVSPLATPADTD